MTIPSPSTQAQAYVSTWNVEARRLTMLPIWATESINESMFGKNYNSDGALNHFFNYMEDGGGGVNWL